MARKVSDTSRLAYETILKGRDNHYKKIILALEWIMDGTAWQIATQARLKPDQVWKRLSELVASDIIFDTGIRRNSPDGNKAMVYAMTNRRSEYANVPQPEKYTPKDTTASDIACAIIAKTKQGRLVQQQLFDGT